MVVGTPHVGINRNTRLACWTRRCFTLVVLGGFMAGCENPDRISMIEYQEMEASLREQAAEDDLEQLNPQQITLADHKPYRVQVGDEMTVTMVGLQADQYAPVEIVVRVHPNDLDQAPQISLPVVGVISLSDGADAMTLGQVEQAVLAAHRDLIGQNEMAVHANLVGSKETTVLVFGAAATPGMIRLRQDERNPLYAVAAAGGFQGISSGIVRVKSAQPQLGEVVYDFNDINDIRRALIAPPLDTGDTVVVEAAEESAIYVTGLIQRPGPILVPPHSQLSVRRAIAAAGGIREYIQVAEATLTRRMNDGEQVMVKLELGKMLAGREPDVALVPGDVLHIPNTVETMLQEWAVRNIVIGPFSIGMRYDPLAQYNAERALRQDNNVSLGDAIRSSLGSTIPQVVVPPVVP